MGKKKKHPGTKGCEPRPSTTQGSKSPGLFDSGSLTKSPPTLDPGLFISQIRRLNPTVIQCYDCITIKYDEKGIEKMILKGITEWLSSKRPQITSVGEGEKKKESCALLVGM